MTSCDRFEKEGLLLLEQGRSLDEHYETCADCRRAREEFGRLSLAIGEVDAGAAPRDGWQRRVLAEVDSRDEKHRRRWLWYALPVGAAAALTAFLLVRPLLMPSASRPVTLVTEIRRGTEAVLRGQEAHPGDLLLIRWSPGSFAHAELRVYLNERNLVVRCTDEPPCHRREDLTEAEVTLEMEGSYQPVLFLSDQQLPETGRGFDADAGAALRSGGEVRIGETIEVR